MTTQLDIDVCGPARAPGRSQWFTPGPTADRMVTMAPILPRDRAPRVLEPSAGDGALVRAVLRKRPEARVTAWEIDPRLEPHLRRSGAVAVYAGDFLAYEDDPADGFDLAILNPPYEDGADGRFLEAVMRVAREVRALVRLDALEGIDRHRRVWSHVDRRAWSLATLGIFSARPKFGGAYGGGMNGMCVVRLVSWPMTTEVVWW